MTRPLRVVIGKDHFRRLVAGQVVTYKAGDDRIEIEFILSDIGWPHILRAVLDGIAPEPGLTATGSAPKGPPDPPQAREFLPRSGRR
jgi:hypothetical protein